MRLLPHIVTLYNVERTTDKTTMKDTLTNHITVLQGVFLSAVQSGKAGKPGNAGNAGASGAELHIPFSVSAVDALTASPRTFSDPVSYHGAEDRSGLWTLEPAPSCFFVKGTVAEPDLTFQEINGKYPDVYAVTAVRTCDFGAEDLRHWEVAGA